jgi:4-amino-4-deoxy-L-arabinose transferase-like glycosyltransferase/membrane-associated phospholipid phosphatase
MHWLQTCDVELLRFINQTLSNSVLDVVMPFASGSELSVGLLYPTLVIAGLVLLWKGGARGAVFLLMLALAVGLTDGLVCNTIKHALGRPRPFLVLPDVHCLIGKGGSGSMPSSHAANWFAATMVGWICYRRTAWFMVPAASVVSFSRIYNGVHYPSDVLAGALLGAGCGAATVLVANALWSWTGRKWFPIWWHGMPSLVAARSSGRSEEEEETFAGIRPPRVKGRPGADFKAPHVGLDAHWLRLGYVCIVLLLVGRWAYVAGGTIQLAEDEAYQWLWSKHLALSYFSKPPLIAYTQFLGTSLWGDRAFGVRFFSPLIAAMLSLMMLRFFAREVNARAGFFLVLIVTATPLLSVGAVLMTVDPLSVLFWTGAMLAGWPAVQEHGTTRDWLWVGLWMGLGFLSKYTGLLQLLSWALFFGLWPAARRHLRRPGPWLALVLNAACSLPVLVWNAQRNWITVAHVANTGGVGSAWHPTPRYIFDFLGSELGLLNPIFFIATVWAVLAFWGRERHNPRLVYFFSMGAPVFVIYLLWSVRSRILPNWIAPSVMPLFCLMVIYWDTRLRLGVEPVKAWLKAGLMLGFVMVVLGHNTNLVQKFSGHYLPVKLDPLHRVREWDTTARVAGQAREQLLAEGKPVFIITDHYGLAGQISFYLPEARARVRSEPLVYCRSTEAPENQFYFWPGYDRRKGQSAVYIRELDRDDPTPRPAPERLLAEFESVTDTGVTNVMYHGQYLLRPLQIFACRGLK